MTRVRAHAAKQAHRAQQAHRDQRASHAFRLIVLLLLAIVSPLAVRAEQLTVHVVDADTGKPISGIVVQLMPDPCVVGKRKPTEVKSNKAGIAVFAAVNVSAVPWSVGTFSISYEQDDPIGFIASPDIARTTACSNAVVTTFPAEMTLHLRKRGWLDRISFLAHLV